MSAENNVTKPKTYLEDLVGGFGNPDATDRLEALARTDPFSLGILTRSIGPSDLQGLPLRSRKGRRRFGP